MTFLGAVITIIIFFLLWEMASDNQRDKEEYERVTGRNLLTQEYPDTVGHGTDSDFEAWKAAGRPPDWGKETVDKEMLELRKEYEECRRLYVDGYR